jgi:hypothetical protein
MKKEKKKKEKKEIEEKKEEKRKKYEIHFKEKNIVQNTKEDKSLILYKKENIIKKIFNKIKEVLKIK